MWNMLTLIFNLAGIILLFKFVKYKWDDYNQNKSEGNFWTFRRHKYILTLGPLLLATLALIEFVLPAQSPLQNEAQRMDFGLWLGILTALVISLTWANYLWKLDIFEPEKWHHLLIVFLAGSAATFLVFPISDRINTELDFHLNNEVVNDVFYCFIGIGMLEEFVKILPIIILLRFKNIVNEPYDFLLYASISALGFAFVENAMYINNTDFYAVNGRALMSTVAHMTFSSVIGYGFMVASYKSPANKLKYIIGAFLVASFMHGFYDFWLINPTAKQWSGLTYLFFILTVHYWFTLKNKAINASYFYDRKIRWINSRLKYYLLSWLVIIFSISVLLIGVFHGSSRAHVFFTKQFYAYGFLIYYLGFSFSKFKIAPKVAATCQILIEKTIPSESINP